MTSISYRRPTHPGSRRDFSPASSRSLVSTGLSTDFDGKYYTKNSPITGSDGDGLRGHGPEHKAEMLAIAARMVYKTSGFEAMLLSFLLPLLPESDRCPSLLATTSNHNTSRAHPLKAIGKGKSEAAASIALFALANQYKTGTEGICS